MFLNYRLRNSKHVFVNIDISAAFVKLDTCFCERSTIFDFILSNYEVTFHLFSNLRRFVKSFRLCLAEVSLFVEFSSL